ncbi:MAG: ribonuclease P protein component [Maribacter sp.]|jgi:ribonuclease P protein component
METKRTFTFKKEEKLKRRKEIDRLFIEGKSFHQYPVRWVWSATTMSETNPFPCQVSVSVSKRKFKLAVDRNRVKRLMREAWRLNKHRLYDNLGEEERYSIMLIYTAKEELPLERIENKVKRGMKLFLKHRFLKDTKK